jgi:zinc protease
MRPLVLLLITVLGLHGQVPPLTEVQERRLANGIRVLWVERRGLRAFHGALVFRGGRAQEPQALAGATDLLARALYGTTWPEDLGHTASTLDPLLKREEGLLESLRLAKLHPAPDANAQISALEAALQLLQAQLREHLSQGPLRDVYQGLGGRLSAEVSEDALTVHEELPTTAFELWCRTETQRLTSLRLSRFYPVKEELLAQVRGHHSDPLGLVRGAALPGHPYGRQLRDHLPSLEALRRSDVQTYARRTLIPERMALVLVSGQSLDTGLPLLERTFGALPMPMEPEESLPPEMASDLGDRRIQASLGDLSCLLSAWRIPPRQHPDHLALRVVAQILGDGPSGRLQVRLVGGKAIARSATLEMDVPGAQQAGLLVAQLIPASGHTLEELDGALHSEVLRLQQEPIPQEEWQRALAQLEMAYLRTLDEPAVLAGALGRAWVECGDWRQLGLEMQRLRSLTPEIIQAAARTWLSRNHRTTALLQPSLTESDNPLEQRTIRILGALAALRIEDPAQRELLLHEGLRQLRMLSPQERLRTLDLLEAQLPKANQ